MHFQLFKYVSVSTFIFHMFVEKLQLTSLILTRHILQVGTSTRMVTTETTATPSAPLAPGNRTDPRLQQAM